MSNYNVVAVTVTYNRVNTLEKTVDALTNQSYKLKKIIIVDNNSNEKSKLKLKEIEKMNNLVEVVWKEKNLGGAGGFHYGVKYALEKYNPDWYWIMDDDAYPKEDCLENLLSKENNLDSIGFLAPVIYGIDNNEYQMYHHKFISQDKVNDITAFKSFNELNNITKLDANAFVGPLFSKKAIEMVGIPDKDLFIYGDDTEYTYRVSRKLNGYLIKEAKINHQDPPVNGNVIAPEAWWKEYYMFRNRFLFIKKFSDNKDKEIKSIRKLKAQIYKKMLATLIKPGYKGFRNARLDILKRAISDGINSNSGKTIDPGEYIKKIKDIRKRLEA
ncbi:glycosyltransferase [Clostridium perfringens]|nr:glycosyltransferase [Clostridium perfringens]